MAMKRKCEFESDETSATKQHKSIPFPNYDNDVAMSDAPSDFDALSAINEAYHTRLASDASTSSSVSVSYNNSPVFDHPTLNPSSANASPRGVNIGLLQPDSSFRHHGSSCTQIPKLRVACAAGLDGRRTMWSFCEECGAISMVDSD